MKYIKLNNGDIDWRRMCILYEECLDNYGINEEYFDKFMLIFHREEYLEAMKKGGELK